MNKKYPTTSPTVIPKPNPKTPIIVLIIPISNLVPRKPAKMEKNRRKSNKYTRRALKFYLKKLQFKS